MVTSAPPTVATRLAKNFTFRRSFQVCGRIALLRARTDQCERPAPFGPRREECPRTAEHEVVPPRLGLHREPGAAGQGEGVRLQPGAPEIDRLQAARVAGFRLASRWPVMPGPAWPPNPPFARTVPTQPWRSSTFAAQGGLRWRLRRAVAGHGRGVPAAAERLDEQDGRCHP